MMRRFEAAALHRASLSLALTDHDREVLCQLSGLPPQAIRTVTEAFPAELPAKVQRLCREKLARVRAYVGGAVEHRTGAVGRQALGEVDRGPRMTGLERGGPAAHQGRHAVRTGRPQDDGVCRRRCRPGRAREPQQRNEKGPGPNGPGPGGGQVISQTASAARR